MMLLLNSKSPSVPSVKWTSPSASRSALHRRRIQQTTRRSVAMTALVISTVWPEPQSSAAGMRTMNIIEAMQKYAKWDVACISPSNENRWTEILRSQGVRCTSCPDNDPIAFQHILSSIKPQLVIFDRFINEEKFGWQVQQLSPTTLRVIDTQDLHFLRKARQDLVRDSHVDWKTVINLKPDCTSKEVIRELAAILRSDLSLLISRHECSLLSELKSIPEHKLLYFPFAYEKPKDTSATFEDRQHFVMLGNFRHPPNRDSLHYVAKEVWPLVRVSLDEKHALKTQLHVYGAYPDNAAQSYTKKSEGLIVKGPIDDHIKMLGKYRVNLAALRFGAGLKGKVTDGWFTGTPVVGTSIAAEGLQDTRGFGGIIANTPDEIADACKKLYEDKSAWTEAQNHGQRIMNEEFEKEKVYRSLIDNLTRAIESREPRRKEDLLSNILFYHQFRSDEFFSRWIHLKNTLAPAASEIRSPTERLGRLILAEIERNGLQSAGSASQSVEPISNLFSVMEMQGSALQEITKFVGARGVELTRLTDQQINELPDSILRPRGPAEFVRLRSASGRTFIAVLSSGAPYVNLYAEENERGQKQ